MKRGLLVFLLVIAGSISSFAVEFIRHAIALPEGIWSIEAADMNHDGKKDIVAMGETKVFVLTAPNWEPSVWFDSVEPKMLYCVALDMDGDGDLDIALGRYRVPWIEYAEAKAKGKDIPEPKGPDFSVAWLENTGDLSKPAPLHVLNRTLNGIHGLCAADVDSDGIKDLISDSIMGPSFPNSLVWFKVGQGSGASKLQVITKNGADGRPHYLDFADINKDGRGDVLLGDSQGGTFTWWEQTSQAGEWIKHLVAKEPGATNLRPADLNHEGKIDLVGSCGHGKGVFWFEAPNWTKHIIDADLATPHALAIADFDGDGDLDIATASFTAFVVRWYENKNGAFIPHDIDTGHNQQAYDLKPVDLNGDGRVDLILAGRESHNAVWYENKK